MKNYNLVLILAVPVPVNKGSSVSELQSPFRKPLILLQQGQSMLPSPGSGSPVPPFPPAGPGPGPQPGPPGVSVGSQRGPAEQ